MIQYSVRSNHMQIIAALGIAFGLILFSASFVLAGGGGGGSSSGGGGSSSGMSNFQSCGSSCSQYTRGGETYQTRSADYNRDGDIRDANEVHTSCVSCDGGGGGGGGSNGPSSKGPGGGGGGGGPSPKGPGGGGGTPGGGGGGGAPACTPTACVSAANFCGQTNSGTRACTVGATCSAVRPSNTTCTGFDIPSTGGGLTVNPVVVREGDPVTITYNVGTQNYYENCVLAGPGISGNPITGQSGTVNIPQVTGAHQYTLTCGTTSSGAPNSVNVTLRVIPALYES